MLDFVKSYYGDSEFLGCEVQPPKIACAVIGPTVVKVGISNGEFGVFITVLESKVILIVDHLLDSPVIPAMASDVKGLIVYYHLSRGLKEQPISRYFQVHGFTLVKSLVLTYVFSTVLNGGTHNVPM